MYYYSDLNFELFIRTFRGNHFVQTGRLATYLFVPDYIISLDTQ